MLDAAGSSLAHRRVADLPTLLQPGDLLVVNDSRVLPARLRGRRAATSGKWEGLFLSTTPSGAWALLSQTRGRLKIGETIEVLAPTGSEILRLAVRGRTSDRHLLAEPQAAGSAWQLLECFGHTPIPPYIRNGMEDPADREHYQTVYAAAPGSVAAPTAGLHFTPELLHRLGDRGIGRAEVTLHVGVGTFAPLRPEQLASGALHREWCAVPEAAARAIAATRQGGGRVIAVGTTSARTLETWAAQGSPSAWSGETTLFIRPPFTFRVIDGLMTNFHLPRSSLLMLVAALIGRDRLLRAYELAVRERYRFFSYGDAMLAWRGLT